MSRTAGEIMERQVLTVSPDTPLLNVHRLFVEEQIHGAPVVADDGAVLGVISSADLLRAVCEEHEGGRGQTDYLRDLVQFSGPDWTAMPADFQDRLGELTAAECMDDRVVSVAQDTPVSEVAGSMRRHRIHRVLVLEQEQLVGIVTSFDLMGLVEKDHEA